MNETKSEMCVWEALVPSVQHYHLARGGFPIRREVYLWSDDERCRTVAAQALISMERISRLREQDPAWILADEPRIARIHLSITTDLDGDEYRLQVEPTGISLESGTAAGIARGLATLYQAVIRCVDSHDSPGRADVVSPDHAYEQAFRNPSLPALPAATITDYPHHRWRGFMFDTSRHFFPGEVLHRMLDFLWFFRLNRYQLHLTDDQGWRIPIEGYPRLTEVGAWRDDGTSEEGRYGGCYTREELRRLDAAAGRLGIEIVPEIDLPGHASAALAAYPELGCDRAQREIDARNDSAPAGAAWTATASVDAASADTAPSETASVEAASADTAPSETASVEAASAVETRWGIFEAVLCPESEETQRFVHDVFASVAEIFSGGYIHIGGDEVLTTAWHGCARCRDAARRRGLQSVDELYGVIVRKMAEAVISQGKRPIAWDEASERDLPRETIIGNWREPEFAAAALERGYDIVLMPQNQRAYLDHKHWDDATEAGRLGVCTVRDSASFEPDRYVNDAVCSSGGLPGDGVRDGGAGARDAGAEARDTGAGVGVVLGGQANLWTEAVSTGRQAEYMALIRLAAISQGLWSGEPGLDTWVPRFNANLETLRRALFLRGYNVYPGRFE